MRKLLVAIFLAVAMAGCRKAAAPAEAPVAQTDQVAVVDMGQVAKDLGWIDQLEANLTTLNNRKHDQVGETQQSYKTAIQKVEAGFSPQPDGKLTPEQQQTIVEMTGYSQRIISQLESVTQAAIDQYRQQCLSQYRDAISPVVGDVARARKMTVVIDKTDTMLFSDPTVDLTTAVSAAARQNIPALTPIPLPTLPEAPALTVPTTPQTAPSTSP
jgi:Skp family chaperone for outer membrane proteins